VVEQERQQRETLRAKVKKLKCGLQEHAEKRGKSGKPRKSNLTDTKSAKMKRAHGVMQGYDGVAVGDTKQQVIVHAEAFGPPQAHELLEPLGQGTRENFQALGAQGDSFEKTKLTADAGFHTAKNMQRLFEEGSDCYGADILCRKRDPRHAAAARYKPQEDKMAERFTPKDLLYDSQTLTCRCPAGKRLYLKPRHLVIRGYQAVCFLGAKCDCGPCELGSRCLKNPRQSTTRQVYFFAGRSPQVAETFTAKMTRKIDSLTGRYIYGQRLGTVEPVFANLRRTLGLNRFMLRGKRTVNGQWLLYCVVHNLLKIHRYSSGFA